MKKLIFLTSLTILIVILVSLNNQKIVIANEEENKIFIMNKKQTNVEWELEVKSLNNEEVVISSIVVNPKGEIAVAYKSGARLYNIKKEMLWDYKFQGPGELSSIGLSKNGGFYVAISGNPSRIVELDKKGKEIATITFDIGVKDIHNQFKQITKTSQEHYIIPNLTDKTLLEIDKSGEIIKKLKTGYTSTSVFQMKNGNYLTANPKENCCTEIDSKTGEIIKVIDEKYLDDDDVINNCTQAEILPNGHLIYCNWNKKPEDIKYMHMVEYSGLNDLWKFRNSPIEPKVSSFYYVNNGNIFKK